MPWNNVLFNPGIDVNKTQYLNDGGWSLSNLIRFRDGLPEKTGGWARMADEAMVGSMRGAHAWADLSGNPYFAAGSEQRLQVLSIDGITDITPLRVMVNITPDFSTTALSTEVVVVDAAHAAVAGDWINIVVPIAVTGSGLNPLHGFYEIDEIVNINSYKITAATAATNTVNNVGATPRYYTTNLSPTVRVELQTHGKAVGEVWINQVSLTVGGLTFGAYEEFFIVGITDANNFTFTASSNATSTTNAFENTNLARIAYLVATGYATAELVTGFGVGLFGAGYFGISGAGANVTVIRQWFLDNWGELLIGNYPASPVFVWTPPVSGGNVAEAVDSTNYPSSIDPPQAVNVTFVAMPEQILVALGCEPVGGGTLDPNLVRWCDVADFTDWVATSTNQAGSFRIPTGSRLVGGIQGPTFAILWTDIDMWTMSYIGFPLVFGFNKISGGVGLLAARCRCIAQGGMVYWASSNAIWRFNGSSVEIVPCPVWDYLWRNLNRRQIDKCHMAANAWFNEVTLYFASADGDGEVDSYIRYNYRDNVWDCGLLDRLCWVDANVFGPPIGVAADGLIQQHEIATDADGQQMGEYIESGYASLDNGWLFTDIQKVMADFKLDADDDTIPSSLEYHIITKDYSNSTANEYGPFTALQGPTAAEYETINARGRVAAIRIGNSAIGTFWRLGNYKNLFSPNGSN